MPSLASYSVSHHKKQTSKSQLLRNNRAFSKLGILCSAGCQSVLPGVLSALHDLRDSSAASLPGSEPLLESHANVWGHNAPSKSNPLRVPTAYSIAANACSLTSNNAELASPRIDTTTDLEMTASCHSPFPVLRRWKTFQNIPATSQRETCSSAACQSTNSNNAQIQRYQGTNSQGVTSPEAVPAMNYLFSSSSSTSSSPPSGLRAPSPSPVQNYGEPSSPRQLTSLDSYVRTQSASQRTLTQPTTTLTNTQHNHLPYQNAALPVNSRHVHLSSRAGNSPAYSSAIQALIDRKLNSSDNASARNHNHSTQAPAVHRSAGGSDLLINKLTNGKRHSHHNTTPYSRPPAQRPQERDTLLLNSYPRSTQNSTNVSTQTWWPSATPSTTSTQSSHETKKVAPPPYGWAPHVIPSKPPPQKRLSLYQALPSLSEPYPREKTSTDPYPSQNSTAL